jgi:hypothetical protein
MGSIPSASTTTHKIAPSTHGIVQTVPAGAVLLRVLKTVENELRRRKMVGNGHETVTPIWFLAETERNIFLWRQGKSLDEMDDFEFWIDLPKLLSKRRAQLENPQGLNPFTNPHWGNSPLDTRTVQQERDYLDDIEDLAECIIPHAEALSRASLAVQAELSKGESEALKVLLPVAFKRRESERRTDPPLQ